MDVVTQPISQPVTVDAWPPEGVDWYYTDAAVVIAHGDCRDILPALPKVDLVFTSPPYNLLNSTGGGMKDGRGSAWTGSAPLRKGYESHSDDMPEDEYVTWQRDCLTLLMDRLSPHGALFYNHKWRPQGGLLQDRKEIVAGFPLRQVIIWDRAMGFNFNRAFFTQTYEVIYLIAQPSYLRNPDALGLTDIWHFPPDQSNDHPAPFPIELPKTAIQGSAKADTILDPFMGSGTTLRAAKDLGRKAIGIEIEERYCETAAKRMAQTAMAL